MNNMIEYPWAQNGLKVHFAKCRIQDRIKQGEKFADFEEAVKQEYIRMAGVVIDVGPKEREVAEVEEPVDVEEPKEIEEPVEVEKPVRRTRRTAQV